MAIEEINNEPQFTEKGIAKISDREREPIPLPFSMRDVLYNLLARHGASDKTFPRIADILLEEYNTIVSVEEIERIYNANRLKVVTIRKGQREGLAVQTEKLLNRTNVLLEKELTRASKDMDKRDALDAALEAGAIDDREYKRAIKNLRVLTIGDIVKLGNYLTPKAPAAPPPPLLPSPHLQSLIGDPNSPAESALSKELADAVAKGDTVEIQRILWSQNPSAQSNLVDVQQQTAEKNPPSNSADTPGK